MTHIQEALRSGSWLTGSRIRIWTGALAIGFIFALAWLIFTSHGLNDAFGRPLGTDFSDIYAAGRLSLTQTPGAPYDFVTHHGMERKIFGEDTPFYGWHYPPVFLLVANTLGRMPYLTALILWQAVTLLLYILAMCALARRYLPGGLNTYGWVLTLVFPAVFVNLTHGQNGFLTTALFAGALAMLEVRPFLAGMLFGALCYKPQFGILLPFVLAISRQGRAFSGAVLSVALLVSVTTLCFGPDVWIAFLHSARFTREIILEQGATGFQKIQSIFAAVRHVGGGIDVAYLVQTAFSLMIAACVLSLWRKNTPAEMRGAALIIGTLLITPYVLDYDLMLLAPAILLLTAHGLQTRFVPWEKTMLAALWLMPVATREIAKASYIPAGLILMTIGFFLLLRKARAEESRQNTNLS